MRLTLRWRWLVPAAACCALAGGLIIAGMTPAEAARPAATGAVTAQDRAFLTSAIRVNIAELGISRTVQAKVAPPLDNVAAMYVTDHTRALGQLRPLAASLGVTPPDAATAAQQAEAAQIESQTGHALNMAFARASVIAHQQAIVLFRRELADGGNGKVKDAASAAMPVLTRHLMMARQAASELGVAVTRMPAGAPATGAGGVSGGGPRWWLLGAGMVAALAGLGTGARALRRSDA